MTEQSPLKPEDPGLNNPLMGDIYRKCKIQRKSGLVWTILKTTDGATKYERELVLF